jgi:hypothetical protein
MDHIESSPQCGSGILLPLVENEIPPVAPLRSSQLVDEEVASKEYIPTSDEVLKLVGSKVIKEFAPFGIFKGTVVSYEVYNMCVVFILPYHFYLSVQIPLCIHASAF